MPLTTVKDLTGQRFGKLTVLRREPRDNARAFWLCRCECGQETVKMGKYLLCGDTSSCGCAQRDYRASGHTVHGGTLKGVKTREYVIWRSMKSRCYTKSSSNYRFYGGRGITMCDRWREDFAAFIADMGPCPAGFTIDRIDTNQPYEPSNCRWASWDTQHNNTRRNIRVQIGDRRMTLAQYVREAAPDLDYHTIWHRMKREGEPAPDAVKALRLRGRH